MDTQRAPAQDFQEAQDYQPLHGKSRTGFIRKVYGIITAQVLVTALWNVILFNSPRLQQIVQTSDILNIVMIAITLICTFTLALSRDLAKQVPLNYYLLAGVTFSTAYSLGIATLQFDPAIVVQAFVLTAAAFAGITYYATTTNGTWNYLNASVYCSLAILVVSLGSYVFLPRGISNLVLSALFALASGIGLMIQTEYVIGKKEMQYSQDDYIQASMRIYTELVNLFLELLKILDSLQDKKKDDKKKK